MRRLTVASAQTGPVFDENPEAALPAALGMIADAAKRNVDIVCFSEVFLTPFFPNRLVEEFDGFFTPLDGPVVARAAEAARDHGIAVILPVGEKAAAGYFNSAVVIDKNGRRAGVYRKTHIPAYFPTQAAGGTGSYEKFYFAPGNSLSLFELEGVRFGIQICNDRLYPEPSRVLALGGAEIIFMPICYSTYDRSDYRANLWEIPLRARAFENGVFVVAANRVGQEGPRHHLGRSMVVAPNGEIMTEAGTDKPELLVATIDLDAVTAARKKFPWWRDRRPDLYQPITAPYPA
ncbi:MAG: apolipoprotein acyltransferase [Alphaproteobacteria bacterium]|nr:MAG: apolipoprotein acyltransferase [Alphaproteobacteria bacterium]